LKLLYNPANDIENQVVQGLLQKLIFTKMPELLIGSFKERSNDMIRDAIGEDAALGYQEGIIQLYSEFFPENLPDDVKNEIRSWISGETVTLDDANPGDTSLTNFNEAIDDFFSIETEQLIGRQVSNPGATRQVGGYSVMFMLFSLSFAATSLLEEKRSDLFNRILSTGIKRTDVLWSKYLFTVSLGWIQLMSLFFAGWLMFRIDFFENITNLAITFGVISITVAAYGMLLASICKTIAQASGLSTLLNISMSALGGAWFPVSFMPETIQFFSKFTVVYWAQGAIMKTIWNQEGLSFILPELLVLLGIAALLTTFSIWRFRKGDLFQK
jgi:ABC-2 type transport system permease protein